MSEAKKAEVKAEAKEVAESPEKVEDAEVPVYAGLNIFQRINAIQQRVTYLQKDGAVQIKTRGGQTFTYHAVTHDAVVAALRQHLVEFGVLVIPSVVNDEYIPESRISKLTIEVTFLSVDGTTSEFGRVSDQFTIKVSAYGQDMNDKGPGKALSYGVKYALLKTFLLETGESDESRVELIGQPVSAKQYAELFDLLKKTDTESDQFIDYLKNKHQVDVEDLSELPSARFALARSALQAKLKKLEETTNAGE